jgi:Bacterial protein of unknown function (DUF899)
MTKSPESDRKGEQPAKHTPAIVSPQAWEAARQQLLVKEKAQMRAHDALQVGEVEHIRMSGVPSDGRFGTSASAAVFTSVDLPFTPCWLGGARCAAALPPAGAEVRP